MTGTCDLERLVWRLDAEGVDWDELAELYRIAPLGRKDPDRLRTVFGNSAIRCFVYDGDELVAAARALTDGWDCAYIADVAVRPRLQGCGLGSAILRHLLLRTSDHEKVLLYASPGTEPFYDRLGFLPMRTARAVFRNPQAAIASGVLADLAPVDTSEDVA